MKDQITFLKKLKHLGVKKFKNQEIQVVFEEDKKESALFEPIKETKEEKEDELPEYVRQILEV